MRFHLAALGCLAIFGLLALAKPWPGNNMNPWPGGAVTVACSSDFCDCPEATDARLCQDFEDGTADCDGGVLKSYGTMNLLGEIGYADQGTPTCADATSPLDGTYSWEGAEGVGYSESAWWPVDAGGVGDLCTAGQDCTMRFLLNVQSDDGGAGVEPIASMFTDGGLSLCGVKYVPQTNVIRLACQGGVTIMSAIDNGTTYKLCAQYTQDDDCTVSIDPANGTWCAGSLDQDTRLNCNAGSHLVMGYVTWTNAGDAATVNIDNMWISAD